MSCTATLHSVVLALLISGGVADAQGRASATGQQTGGRGAAIGNARFSGCYEISTARGPAASVVGRFIFEPVSSGTRDASSGNLSYMGGPRAGPIGPRARWRASGDSITILISYIDSGLSLTFAKFTGDTIRGTARGTGLTDTTTVSGALAVRQRDC
jgi:hypothetical protein